ncbi:hypothetical protein ASC90_26345 [Rhizobium sp. Root1220]|nr:hypothetical protein ASC90_26345 [Rhizobium sp. Root1220]
MLLDNLDDLKLLVGGVGYLILRRPIPIMFFKQAFSTVRSASASLAKPMPHGRACNEGSSFADKVDFHCHAGKHRGVSQKWAPTLREFGADRGRLTVGPREALLFGSIGAERTSGFRCRDFLSRRSDMTRGRPDGASGYPNRRRSAATHDGHDWLPGAPILVENLGTAFRREAQTQAVIPPKAVRKELTPCDFAMY